MAWKRTLQSKNAPEREAIIKEAQWDLRAVLRARSKSASSSSSEDDSNPLRTGARISSKVRPASSMSDWIYPSVVVPSSRARFAAVSKCFSSRITVVFMSCSCGLSPILARPRRDWEKKQDSATKGLASKGDYVL